LRGASVSDAVDDTPDSTFVRGPLREVAVEGTCPLCGGTSLVMRSLPLDLPYFGEALQTTVVCQSCSFRHPDLLLTREAEPARYELSVAGPHDLSARVVRSASGTIRVPELRATIEPGPRAEAFVSNAEGVLRRLRDIADFGVRASETPAARRTAERIVATIDAMIAGGRPFTLIIEDPTGNSAILHDRARKRTLTVTEARRLKRGSPEFRVAP